MSDFSNLSDEELTAQLAGIGQKYEKIDTAFEQLNVLAETQQAALQEALQAYYAAKKVIEEKLADITAGKQKLYQVKQKGNDEQFALKAELERREEERRKAEELKRLQEANALLNERWNRVLIGAPWREWARDYQIEGAKQFAQQKTMILADAMGLGKTLTSIISLDFIRAATETASPENPYEPDQEHTQWLEDEQRLKVWWTGGAEKPCGLRVLYVAPNGLQSNAAEEFAHWAPHRTIVPLANESKGTRNITLEVVKNLEEFVVVINFEAWVRDKALLDTLASMRFDTLIIDEAHSIKDTSTSAYQGIKQIVQAERPVFILPMTGTPILNNPIDLYPPLNLIQPDKFWSSSSFLNRFCTQEWTATGRRWVFRSGGVASIGNQLGKKYLRRTKETADLNLPPLTVQTHSIEIDDITYAEQAGARKMMRERMAVMLKEYDDDGNKKAISAASVLAQYTRLRQIETWPAGIKVEQDDGSFINFDVEESQKLDYTLNINGNGLLKDLVDGEERVVLFSQFKTPLDELARRAAAAGIRVALLTGDTPEALRKEIRHDFDAKFREQRNGQYQWDVVLCHYRVGGQGLNFTEASEMVILDEEWNPGKRDQAYGRIERLGQEKPMTVHVLHMKNTIDDWLSGLMAAKEDLVEGFNTDMPSAEDVLKAIESGLL